MSKTETRTVTMTPEDIVKAEHERDEAYAHIGAIAVTKAKANAEASAQTKFQTKIVDRLVANLDAGEHDVTCRIKFDLYDGKAHFFRQDTGAWVACRALTEEERQQPLNFDTSWTAVPEERAASPAAKAKSPGLKELERIAVVPPSAVPDEVRAAVIEAGVPDDMTEAAIGAIRAGADPATVIANAKRGSRPAKAKVDEVHDDAMRAAINKGATLPEAVRAGDEAVAAKPTKGKKGKATSAEQDARGEAIEMEIATLPPEAYQDLGGHGRAAIADLMRAGAPIGEAVRAYKQAQTEGATRGKPKGRKAPELTPEQLERRSLADEMKALLGQDIGTDAAFAVLDGMDRDEAIAKGEAVKQLFEAEPDFEEAEGSHLLNDVFNEGLSVEDAIANARLHLAKVAEARA